VKVANVAVSGTTYVLAEATEHLLIGLQLMFENRT
jgi:hypothetical protein